MIIALEGIDACGKATQSKALVEVFSDLLSIEHVETFDFPHYSTYAGAVIGRVLRGETLVCPLNDANYCAPDAEMAEKTIGKLRSDWGHDKALIIQALMCVDKLEHQDKLIRFYEEDYNLLILDRYSMSGMVYGMADGLEKGWLHTIMQTLIDPDLTFVLDISVEESMKRRPERRDYYERNDIKLQRVRNLYVDQVKEQPECCFVVDGSLPQEEVTNRIVEKVRVHLNV